MKLSESSAASGNWLFRWRSYLPLFLIALLLPSFYNYHYFGNSHFLDKLWEVVCMMISLFGFAIRCMTVGYVPRGTSGRNTKKQIAETLNMTGMYSLLRNPLYVGNYFMILGVVMVLSVNGWWIPVIFTLAFGLYYERIIMAEEAFLSETFGDKYIEYTSRTSAIFPTFRNWLKPALPFSLRTVLKREYSSLLALVSAMFVLELITDYLEKGNFHVSRTWLILFIVTLALYLTLRTIKKTTRWLDVEGR